MIFIDSNIPMYLAGAEHPHQRETIVLLEKFSAGRERMVTNAEVIQEILHRYTAINRRDAIQKALDALYGFIDDVGDMTESDALKAKDLVLAYEGLSARDALHAAYMKRSKIENIFSFDGGFDILPGIKRVPN